MADDDRMDELMGRALREVDPPPPTPREEIWSRIQAERAEGGNVTRLRPPHRRASWIQWGGAIAASLVIGIGLGRMTSRTAPVPEPAAIGQAAQGEVAAEEQVPEAYRFAAAQHLQRTETLLASVVVQDRGRGAGEISSWARDLLTDTRLLLSSRAANDASTRRLLEDLELVLTQIAGIPAARAEEEVELIQDGINQSDMLLRLRAATAGPRLADT